jgi:Kef-type K+ transport system membrane component KefB
MPAVTFSNLVVVTAVAFAAPLVLGFFPKLRFPAVVLEIVLGIVLGPSMLGWVTPDLPVQILSVVGLAFLLFLAGLEVEVERLRGTVARVAGLGLAVSAVLGLGVGVALKAAGQVRSPLFIGIVLLATSLGLVVPILKDGGQSTSGFGQLVIAGATLGDFGAVILLSLFFSGQASGIGTKLVLLGSFVVVVVVVGLAVARAGRSVRVMGVFERLADTTAQIRVRGAVLLLIGIVAVAERFGLETILGAFMAGVVLRSVDRTTMSHPQFHVKLEAIGFGFLIPVFFVASGLRFDAGALFSSASTLLRVPIFLVALLVVRGVPALAYRSVLDRREVMAGALLQATSLPFIVAATQIGIQLRVVSTATSAALIAAGLLSVLIFPASALALLRKTADMRTTRAL